MLLSTVAKTQMQAMQLSFLFLLPFVFLSGYVFPIAGMPKIFQVITYIIPARYFIEVIRGIVLRGASLVQLWQPMAWLTLYTVLIIGACRLPLQEDDRLAWPAWVSPDSSRRLGSRFGSADSVTARARAPRMRLETSVLQG